MHQINSTRKIVKCFSQVESARHTLRASRIRIRVELDSLTHIPFRVIPISTPPQDRGLSVLDAEGITERNARAPDLSHPKLSVKQYAFFFNLCLISFLLFFVF